MKDIHKWTKREKTLFWAAAMIGLAAGVVGNLFASALWKSITLLFENDFWGYIAIVVIIGAAFLWLIRFMSNQIEKNRPIKRNKKDK